jgi:DNA-binding LacI/PurR family transcriptional regulator
MVDNPGLEALVCVSDSLALGAMMAVNEAGRKSFPIMGFDNTPVAQAVGLSSVEQRLDEVAIATLELLMGATGRRVIPQGTSDENHRLVTPKLVVRRSSHLVPVEETGSAAPGNHNREENQ